MNIRTLTLGAAAALAFAAGAQEVTDTVKVIKNAERLMVAQSGDTTSVKVIYNDSDTGVKNIYSFEVDIEKNDKNAINDFPKDWGMSLPFKDIEPEETDMNKKRTKRYVAFFNHPYWGWRFNYSGNANVKDCFEVGFKNLLGVVWKRGGAQFETGIGINLARFLTPGHNAFTKEGDRLTVAPVDPEVVIRHSRLDVFGFQVPLIYNQKIAGPLQTSIGAILNFNTYAKASCELQEGNVSVSSKYKGLHQNLFGVEAYAAIHLWEFGIYASWKPMKLFDANFGPEVRSWSLGVELIF